jgi:hypothetical protein
MKQDIFQKFFDAGITDPLIIQEVANIALAALHDRQLAAYLMDLGMLNEDGMRRAIQQKIGGR